jgi:DNA-binding GntR family transcriptional regulator
VPKRDRSVMDQAFTEIKRRIVTLEARPGQRLDDVALAKDLSLSRTPVREALFQLNSEGLVNPGDRGGFTVRPLDLFDISQLFEAHIVVARSIARLVVARATDLEIDHLQELTARVEAAIRDGGPAEISATNAELHRAEARFARNEHLRVLANNVHNLGQRLSFLCFGGDSGAALGLEGHFGRVSMDHAEMLDALRVRDMDAAERIAARHVHLFRDRVVEFFEATPVETVGMAGEVPSAPLS